MALIKLNNEQKMMQNEIRKFAIQEIEPIAQDIEKNANIPSEIFKKLTDLGFLCPVLPVDSGGAGMDTMGLCIIIEELSKVSASVGFVVAVNNALAGFSLIKYGKEKQKIYLEKLGKGKIGGFDKGTGELKILQNNPLKITGKRHFMLNGEMADFLLLNVHSDGVSGLYIVDKSNAKIEKFYLLGLRSAGIVDISFDHLELSEDFCLIAGNDFDKALDEVYKHFEICVSAIGLGISQAGLEASIKYSKERRQFNRPICEFPMVKEMLTEMKIKIEATRNLVYDAASRFDLKEDYALVSDIALATSTETAVYCGIKSVQIFGGYGYTKDYPVERYLRDAKTLQILGLNTFELKERIAKDILT